MGKVYNIVILSQLTTTVTGQSSDCLCFFDWSLLPQSRWKCRLTSVLGSAGFTTNQVCQVFTDLGIMNNEMARNSVGGYTGTNRYNSQYVGTIMETNQGANATFYCPATKNPPFYLNQTPQNTSFKLNLVNHGVGQGLFTPNITACIFVLSMEMLDDPIPRNIKNSYNIVFNSTSGNSTLPNSINYQFDWGRLPRGKYQFRTTMMTSKDDNATTFFGPICIFCDLGQGSQTVHFVRNQSTVRPAIVNLVAVLFATGNNINGSGATGALYTYKDQNAPIYLENRPSNNDVLIELRSAYSGLFLPNLPATLNYTIVFHFQWLGE